MRTPLSSRPPVASGATHRINKPVPDGPELPHTQCCDLSATPLPPREDTGFPRIRGYEILSVVGTGGMGIVYEARHKELGRRVAIKTLRGDALADPEFRERFRAEAEAIAKLQHPNVSQVFEVGLVDPGRDARPAGPFIALEFVDGGSLAQHTSAPQPSRAAAKTVATLARAAHAAHRLGVVHRDLKPANVLLTREGEPKIADFGIAKQIDTEYATTGLTRTGTVMGTPEYMAPEQLDGQPVAPGIDVYALGVILYELLTARVPFQGETFADTMLLAAREEPVSPRRLQPNVPRDLETICLKCLEKNPAKRYATADALADDLDCFLLGRTIRARAIGPVERTTRWAKRNPAVAGLSLLVCVVAVVGLIGVVWKMNDARANAARANANAARANASAGTAERALADANEAAESERFERYRVSMFAASGALRLHDTNAARLALDAAPAKYRDWVWHLLTAQLDKSQFVYPTVGRQSQIERFSADGRWAVGVSDGAITLWDTVARTEAVLVPAAARPGNPAVSDDGKLFLYLNPANELVVCEVAGCRKLHTIPGHSYGGSGAHFRDGGRTVHAVGLVDLRGRKHFARVWDVATGKLRGEFVHPDATHAWISPNGATVAVRAPGNKISLWDMATGRLRRELSEHTDEVLSMQYSPTGDRFLTFSPYPNNVIRVWDTATGRHIASCTGHANQINSAAFSPDGGHLITSSMDRTLRLWDVSDSGAPVARGEVRKFVGHTGWVHNAAFSPDGSRIVSGSHDRNLRVWDTRTGEVLGVLYGHTMEVMRVAFGPDGETLCSSANDGTVRLWNARATERGSVLRGHRNFVYGVAFNPDGNRIASAAWDGTARIWDASTGRELLSLPHPDPKIVVTAVFSPDGKTVATLSRDSSVRLWDAATGVLLHRWEVPNRVWPDGRIAFDPTGGRIAVGGPTGKIHILDVHSKTEAAVIEPTRCCIRDLAYSPDGRWLVTVGEDGENSVRVWDTRTLKLARVLPGHRGLIGAVCWSADGAVLASGATDGVVKLWDTSSWAEIGELKNGTTVYSVAFSPNGKVLAIGCADNLIRVWDVARRQELAELSGHTEYVHSVAFSPDGSRLVSGSGDRTIRVWDSVPPGTRARQNEARAPGRPIE